MTTKKKLSQSILMIVFLAISWLTSLLAVYRVSSRGLRKEKDSELKLSEVGKPSGPLLLANVLL